MMLASSCNSAAVSRPCRSVATKCASAVPLARRSRTGLHVTASYKRSTAYDAQKEAEDVGNDLSNKAQDYLETIQTKWEETEEKPAVIAISIASFVAIWAASGVIDAVNKLPIFGGVFELVGLGVTSWFAYRYLFNAADRQELKGEIDDFFKRVGGK